LLGRNTVEGSDIAATQPSRVVKQNSREEAYVKNPLDSLSGTIVCGFILTAILWYLARMIVSHAVGTGA